VLTSEAERLSKPSEPHYNKLNAPQGANLKGDIMKQWEIESEIEGHIRIEWNEAATFNFQFPIGGEWVDYQCFTCYGIETET